MTAERRRLHAAAVAVEALEQLRNFGLVIVAVAFFGSDRGQAPALALAFAGVGALVAVGVACLGWTTTRWWVADEAVHLRRGLLDVSESSVPLARVQAIDTVRGPVQRLFGVVALHVQAAGGGQEGEIVLRAVSAADAEALREAVRAASGHDAGDAEDAPAGQSSAPAWRLTSGRLLVAALSSGSVAILVPVVAFGGQLAEDLVGAERVESLAPGSAAGVAALVAALLAAAWLLSVLGSVVAYAGFTAVREGERLRIRRGLFVRREASVPVARVQAVRVVEGPLREPFGLVAVRLETAGYAGEGATATTLVPVARRAELPSVLDELLPELAGPLDGLAGPPPRARRRYVLPAVTIGVLPGGAAVALLGAPGLAGLLVAAAAATWGMAAHRAAGWRLDGGILVVRRRLAQRVTAIADARRLPELSSTSSLLQRRAGLATLRVGLQSTTQLKVAQLERETVDAVLASLTRLATEAHAP